MKKFSCAFIACAPFAFPCPPSPRRSSSRNSRPSTASGSPRRWCISSPRWRRRCSCNWDRTRSARPSSAPSGSSAIPTPTCRRTSSRREHYRRIAYANNWFGKDSPGAGLAHRHGAHLHHPGRTASIERFESVNEIYPTIVWFYQGMAAIGAARFIQRGFLQAGTAGGEYELYSPIKFGPMALMRNYEGDAILLPDAYNALIEHRAAAGRRLACRSSRASRSAYPLAGLGPADPREDPHDRPRGRSKISTPTISSSSGGRSRSTMPTISSRAAPSSTCPRPLGLLFHPLPDRAPAPLHRGAPGQVLHDAGDFRATSPTARERCSPRSPAAFPSS